MLTVLLKCCLKKLNFTVILMEAEVKRKRGYSSLNMLGKREIGQQFLKHDTLTSKYYKHLKMSWNQDEAHGAIFNLEFSPSGKMLVAACEECAILLYDPLSRKCVHRLPNAHEDSVNTICFCDERIFASGSDDCNVALWDTRMLGEHIMELSGHTGWVKSLVYDTNTKMLLSSAFDGTVRMWDINRSPCSEHDASVTMYSDRDVSCMQVTVNKLIISCQNWENSGDIIIIFHNLDLPNFADDLSGGVPAENENDEVYIRNIPERLSSNSEYIDIPLRIPSFVVHPHGSCLVSRYLTANNDEYTTVHDMQSCFSCGERRLSHYIQESVSGSGFIKEQGFSPDGRVIASPFAHGTRLLAFDSDCSHWRKDSKVKSLSEVKFLLGHSMPVCCSKFSPNHMLLATGCLAGKIAFHEPKL